MPEPARAVAGWGIELRPAICEQCDWHYLLPPDKLALPCPHCHRTTLTALDAGEDETIAARPELLLPFSVPAETVAQRLARFANSIWFAPADLSPGNLQQRTQRLYLPLWLVDSQVQGVWQAEAGFDYEAVSYRETYEDGRWQSQEVTETRIRWEPRVGRLARAYHNIPAPALEEHTALRQRLGQFDLEAGQPYDGQSVANAAVRLPNRSSHDAWPEAVPQLQTAAANECRRAAQADHLREFRWQPEFVNQNWTLLLLPVFTTYYLDDEQQPQPLLIHGQSGQISGPRRASLKRARRIAIIIVAVAAMIFTISLALGLAALLFPPLLLAAGLGGLLAIVAGLLAIVPLAIVWRFNRQERDRGHITNSTI